MSRSSASSTSAASTAQIERVEGFATDAYPEGLQLTRESLRQKQISDLNQFIARTESELQAALAGSGILTVSANGQSTLSEDALSRYKLQQVMLDRLKTVTPTGRVNLRLRADKDGNVKLPAVQLQDGDRIFAGARPATVSVIGMVFSGGDFDYRKGNELGDYLTFAGGLTRAADKSKIYIVGINGESRNTSGAWFRGEPTGAVRPGDSIFVPEHQNPGQFMRGLKDWSQILGQFGLSAAAIKVLMQ